MHLKPQGVLVYSTCTLAPEENEGVISRFLSNGKHAILESVEFPFVEFRPGLTRFASREYHADIARTARILPSKNFE